MGYAVTQLTGADLTPERCAPSMPSSSASGPSIPGRISPDHLPALFAYVEAGGNVIAQYNQSDGLSANWLAPFHLHISRDRVTDEDAPVTFLAPDHPVLTTPNRITAADFDGWVQERGLYFPDQWDERFTADPRLRRSRRDAASRAACSWRGTARAISSTPASRGFGSFPKACPERIGCLPISSRWANDRPSPPDQRSDAEPPGAAWIPHVARRLPVRVRMVRPRGGPAGGASRRIFS